MIFDKLGKHAKRDGSQECLNCKACKEFLGHVLSVCVLHDTQRQLFGTI